jgi:hypothetical protein
VTLTEFLHPLKGGRNGDLCLAALYFHERYEQVGEVTVDGLRALLKRGRVAGAKTMNIAQVLATSAPYVESPGKQGKKFLWKLTGTGQARVRELLELPANDIEVENDVTALEGLAKSLDPDVADYIHEALKCLKVDALRAAVVFTWSGAVKKIRDDVFSCGAAAADDAVRKFDPKAKAIKKADDLVLVKESTLLLAAQELGLFDKNERGTLEECLNLRNKCGHPGKYKVGVKKVSSFLEDVIGTVFS